MPRMPRWDGTPHPAGAPLSPPRAATRSAPATWERRGPRPRDASDASVGRDTPPRRCAADPPGSPSPSGDGPLGESLRVIFVTNATSSRIPHRAAVTSGAGPPPAARMRPRAVRRPRAAGGAAPRRRTSPRSSPRSPRPHRGRVSLRPRAHRTSSCMSGGRRLLLPDATPLPPRRCHSSDAHRAPRSPLRPLRRGSSSRRALRGARASRNGRRIGAESAPIPHRFV